MVPRILAEIIPQNTRKGFINVIYGPRRVGKTVLLKQLTKGVPLERTLWVNGDTQEDRDLFSKTSLLFLEDIVKDVSTVIIDEAQRIPNIALALKVLIDNFPEKTYYATGSSSLLLSKGLRETLTGRTQVYNLYPLSNKELTPRDPMGRSADLLENMILYGGYPYILELPKPNEKRDYLISIVDDYLFREVLYLKDISSPENLRKIATLLAFQIGNEVSLNDLAKSVGIDVKTVKRYISLLEQNFILFSLSGFSRKLDREVSNSRKYYFWDTGIRNAIIDQFLPLDTRADTEPLWENFLAIERMKKHEYERSRVQYHFWRTYDNAAIDWIEESQGELTAFDFMWESKNAKTPKQFLDNYKSELKCVTKENYPHFIA